MLDVRSFLGSRLWESIHFKPPRQIAGALLVFGATGAIAASITDDILVYQQCSSKALERAARNETLKQALGTPIERQAWYKATIGFAHKGCAVSCSFPLAGSHGTAEIRLRAVRPKETGMWNNVFKPRPWELLAVEAFVPIVDGGTSQLLHIRL